MTDIKLTRRTVFGMAGGSLVASGLAGTASASALSEIDTLRAAIGRSYTARGTGEVARVVLEDIVALSPSVRPPMTVAHRAPFAMVFRHENGSDLGDGTYILSDGMGTGTALMVSRFVGDDGVPRLEAVFN